jgi:hypothetical protein
VPARARVDCAIGRSDEGERKKKKKRKKKRKKKESSPERSRSRGQGSRALFSAPWGALLGRPWLMPNASRSRGRGF